MCTMSRAQFNLRVWRDWDDGLEKRGNSEKHGYCPQIPRRLSHTHVVWIITLQRRGTGRWGLLRGAEFVLL